MSFRDESERAKWFVDEVMPHEPILRAYLRKKFPQLATEVDDVVQESFLKTFRAKAEGKLHSARGFLFTAAHNLALDIFRRRQRIAPVERRLADTQTLTIENPTPAEFSIHAQELELLMEAIESLPDRCRQVLKLRKIYGLSHREIAAELGISERTVNVQVGIGLRRCATYFRARTKAGPTGNDVE
jgi:RNA polymerase sigma-70 factor (ECF subfamily)